MTARANANRAARQKARLAQRITLSWLALENAVAELSHEEAADVMLRMSMRAATIARERANRLVREGVTGDPPPPRTANKEEEEWEDVC